MMLELYLPEVYPQAFHSSIYMVEFDETLQ